MNMTIKERVSKAAKAKNIKYTKIRRDAYFENPNLCPFCGQPILPREDQLVCEVTNKIFCSRKCWGLSKVKPKQAKIKTPRKVRQDSTLNKSKKDFHTSKNFHSRVRDAARRIYKSSGKPLLCTICGYDRHYEVCHIKPIEEFEDDALISEINSIENLISLCPNCHWEFDRGILRGSVVV